MAIITATVITTRLALVPVAMGTVTPIAALTMVVTGTVTIGTVAIVTISM